MESLKRDKSKTEPKLQNRNENLQIIITRPVGYLRVERAQAERERERGEGEQQGEKHDSD